MTKIKISADMARRIAIEMKRRNPSLRAEQISAGIAGLQSSTPEQRLRWAMEEREKEREAQKAASPSRSDGRPEPIVGSVERHVR